MAKKPVKKTKRTRKTAKKPVLAFGQKAKPMEPELLAAAIRVPLSYRPGEIVVDRSIMVPGTSLDKAREATLAARAQAEINRAAYENANLGLLGRFWRMLGFK